jgi:hypothetical protein
MTPDSHYHLPDLGLMSSHETERSSVTMSDVVSQDRVIGEDEDESVVVAYGLTYKQIRDLWNRARPSLREPFRGQFDISAFDISPEDIRRDRAGVIGEYPRRDIWSETAALWERHERRFVREFERLVLKLVHQKANPRKVLAGPHKVAGAAPRQGQRVCQTEAACTAGDDDTTFEAQFRLIEQAEQRLAAKTVRR